MYIGSDGNHVAPPFYIEVGPIPNAHFSLSLLGLRATGYHLN